MSAAEHDPKPPYDLVTEQALLGAILVNGAAYERVSEFLTAAHFHNPIHGLVYGAIGELLSEGARPDPVLVKERIGEQPSLVLLGGAAHFVARLMLAAGPPVNAAHYGRTIAGLAQRRYFMQFGADLIQQAADPETPLADLEPWALARLAEHAPTNGALGEWDASDDFGPIPPRGWLLGTVFCRRFVSSLIADGGIGKTALRIAQLLSACTGRSLTGEHVFQRSRVLIVSLEDDKTELRRRISAAMIHHGVSEEEVRGWLFLSAPGRSVGKLATTEGGTHKVGPMVAELTRVIKRRQIDILCIDPFVKSHGVEENSNNALDFVIGILTQIAIEHDCAVDAPHHVSKGPADPGNANRGRGAVAFKDGGRLVYTLSQMSEDEAALFGLVNAERRLLIRMDSGKVNIAPPLKDATWFRLVGVRIGNGTESYPRGDEVQTVEMWEAPDMWATMPPTIANSVLDKLDAGTPDGRRYSSSPRATDRAAWAIVRDIVSTLTEQQAKAVIATWHKNGVIEARIYHDPVDRKDRSGVFVNPAKRPG